jgi:hypothetical protein
MMERSHDGVNAHRKGISENSLNRKDTSLQELTPFKETRKVGDGTAGGIPLSDETLEYTYDIDCEVKGAEEHHEGGSSDETLVEAFALAVVNEDPDCDDEEEDRYAIEKRLKKERD